MCSKKYMGRMGRNKNVPQRAGSPPGRGDPRGWREGESRGESRGAAESGQSPLLGQGPRSATRGPTLTPALVPTPNPAVTPDPHPGPHPDPHKGPDPWPAARQRTGTPAPTLMTPGRHPDPRPGPGLTSVMMSCR